MSLFSRYNFIWYSGLHRTYTSLPDIIFNIIYISLIFNKEKHTFFLTYMKNFLNKIFLLERKQQKIMTNYTEMFMN